MEQAAQNHDDELDGDDDDRRNYSVLLGLLCLFLCIALGVAATISFLRGLHVDELTRQLASSQASARTGWGKYHTLNEQLEDEENAELGRRAVKIFELEQELVVCRGK